jgi:hypothetical protein
MVVVRAALARPDLCSVARKQRVERAEYLAAVQQNPWAFPAVDGCPEPPPEWVAAAWDTKAVQDAIAATIARDVSKAGELFFACTSEFLEQLSAALTTEQVVRLYHTIRDVSPHRESEFRPQFEQGFARHRAALPLPLTWRALVAAVGDEATAASLLGAEPQSQDVALVGYSFRLVSPEAIAEGYSDAQGSAEEGERFTIHHGADYGLHQVFGQLGGPLRFAIAGERSLHGGYDAPPSPSARFSAWVKPETVQQVADALARLPRWRMLELLRALDRRLLQYREGRARYSQAYDTVQEAYATAAKQRAGVSILVC